MFSFLEQPSTDGTQNNNEKKEDDFFAFLPKIELPTELDLPKFEVPLDLVGDSSTTKPSQTPPVEGTETVVRY